jgi:hypothetical protein
VRSVRMTAVVAVTAALTSIGTVGLTAGFAGRAAAATASGSWPETDYNAAASRANLAETTLTVKTVPQVQFLRQLSGVAVPPGNCTPQTGFVAPVLVDGKLFAIANGRLASYDAATGARLWQVLPDPTFTSNYRSLVVSGGLVIIGRLTCDSVSDPNGFVQAFNESTGALVWDSGPPTESNPVSQVVVSNGYVVSVGGTPGGGQVITVRKVSNGATVWAQMPDNDQASAALVVNGLVIQQEQSSLVAYNLATGVQAWSRVGSWQPERGDRATAAAHHLYAVDPAGQVADLNPATGGTQRVLTGATSVLAVDGARAYAICGTGHICAYSTSDGKQTWSLADTSGLAAEAGGVLYLSDGKALNAATGKLLRQIFTYAPGASQLTIGEGRIAASLGATTLKLFGLSGSLWAQAKALTSGRAPVVCDAFG